VDLALAREAFDQRLLPRAEFAPNGDRIGTIDQTTHRR